MNEKQMRWFIDKTAALAKELRQEAQKDYYQKYNQGMAQGLNAAATAIERNLHTLGYKNDKWLEAVQEAIWAKFQGGYFDLENMSDAFMMKIARLYEKEMEPSKAAEVVLRYANFMNYIHAKAA